MVNGLHPIQTLNESEWETTSEEDVGELTIPCPVEKADLSKLTEVPLSAMVKTKSMSWLSHVITYYHPNQAYLQVMVRIFSSKIMTLRFNFSINTI